MVNHLYCLSVFAALNRSAICQNFFPFLKATRLGVFFLEKLKAHRRFPVVIRQYQSKVIDTVDRRRKINILRVRSVWCVFPSPGLALSRETPDLWAYLSSNVLMSPYYFLVLGRVCVGVSFVWFLYTGHLSAAVTLKSVYYPFERSRPGLASAVYQQGKL